MDEGVKFLIQKPGDGQVVSFNFGNLFVNKYGFPIVSVSEDLEDPKI